jgi:hypothetical protein
LAWAVSRSRTCSGLSFGFALRSRATTPATCGAAIDVPSRLW